MSKHGNIVYVKERKPGMFASCFGCMFMLLFIVSLPVAMLYGLSLLKPSWDAAGVKSRELQEEQQKMKDVLNPANVRKAMKKLDQDEVDDAVQENIR